MPIVNDSNANVFDAVYKKVFGGIDPQIRKELVFEDIAGRTFESQLKNGGTTASVDRFRKGRVRNKKRGGAHKIQKFVGQQDLGQIDQYIEYSFSRDNFSKARYQNAGQFMLEKYKDAKHLIATRKEAEFFNNVTKANIVLDAAIIGGTAGNPLALTKDNVMEAFPNAIAEVNSSTGSMTRMFLFVSPHTRAAINTAVATHGYNTGDSAIRNGFSQGLFDIGGMRVCHNLKHEVVVTLSANITDGKYISFGGVKLTVKGTTSEPGDILRGASAEATIDNLVAFAADPSNLSAGTYEGYDEDDEAQDAVLEKLDYISIEKLSASTFRITNLRGRMLLASDATQVTFGTQIEHAFLGEEGAIDFIDPDGVVSDIVPGVGSNKDYLSENWFGSAVREIAKDKFADLQIAV